jgi:hypothetical protein
VIEKKDVVRDAYSLESIALKIDELRFAFDELGVRQQITPETRVLTVQKLIDKLASHLDYYRQSSQEEREMLAKNLDSDLWGWTVNILGGIHKRDGPEVFARRYAPPKRRGAQE